MYAQGSPSIKDLGSRKVGVEESSLLPPVTLGRDAPEGVQGDLVQRTDAKGVDKLRRDAVAVFQFEAFVAVLLLLTCTQLNTVDGDTSVSLHNHLFRWLAD